MFVLSWTLLQNKMGSIRDLGFGILLEFTAEISVIIVILQGE